MAVRSFNSYLSGKNMGTILLVISSKTFAPINIIKDKLLYLLSFISPNPNAKNPMPKRKGRKSIRLVMSLKNKK